MMCKSTSDEVIKVEIKESKQLGLVGSVKDISFVLKTLAYIFGNRPLISVSDEDMEQAFFVAGQAKAMRVKARRKYVDRKSSI